MHGVMCAGRLVGRKFLFSLWMEFMGLMLFSLFGNSVTPEFAPAGNGEMGCAARRQHDFMCVAAQLLRGVWHSPP